MCGFIVCIGAQSTSIDDTNFRAALGLLSRRGPDQTGYFRRPNVLVGTTRLMTVRDTSDGDQPFVLEEEQALICFNGFLANYSELRGVLEAKGLIFKGVSEAELILRGFLALGADILELMRGMWAFVIVRFDVGEFFVCRDRLGIKPLYQHSAQTGYVVYSSEIKAINRLLKNMKPRVNAISVGRYLARGWSDDTHFTFYDDIYHFPAGSYYWKKGERATQKNYWRLRVGSGVCRESSLEEFKGRLFEVGRLNLDSDFALGVPLSGGVDSSGLLGLAKYWGATEKVTAYTLDVPGSESEVPVARETAEFLGISHDVVEFNETTDLEVACSQAVFANDGPLNGINSVYQFLLRKRMNEDGKRIVLTGDGADEIFGGYKKFMLSFLAQYPQNERANFFRKNLNLGVPEVRELSRQVAHFTMLHRSNRFHQRHEVGLGVISEDISNILFDSMNHEGFCQPATQPRMDPLIRNNPFFHDLASHIFVRYLPYILRMEDHLSSYWSLESRVPYLDHELIGAAWKLDSSYFIRNNQQKFLLRESLRGILPQSVLENATKVRKPGSNSHAVYKILGDQLEEMLFNYRGDMLSSAALNLFRQDRNRGALERSYLWMRVFFYLTWIGS